MIVYRICKKNEIDSIFNSSSFSSIGNFCGVFNGNSHSYMKNKKYMHFFDKKINILYLNPSKEEYLCEYNISDEILERYKGIGEYLDFIYWKSISKVEEYAIPSELIVFDNLEKIYSIKDYIEYDDLIEDENLTSLLELNYVKEKQKIKRK